MVAVSAAAEMEAEAMVGVVKVVLAMEAEAMEDVGMARVAVRVVEAWEEAMVWAVAVWFVLRVGQRQSEVMCGLCCCVPSGRQDEGLSERAVQMGIFHHMSRLAARLHHLLDRPTRCATSRTRSTSDPHRTELLRLAARLARPMGLHHQWGRVNCSSFWPILLVQQLFVHGA
jgi:hypothetical protein